MNLKQKNSYSLICGYKANRHILLEIKIETVIGKSQRNEVYISFVDLKVGVSTLTSLH